MVSQRGPPRLHISFQIHEIHAQEIDSGLKFILTSIFLGKQFLLHTKSEFYIILYLHNTIFCSFWRSIYPVWLFFEGLNCPLNSKSLPMALGWNFLKLYSEYRNLLHIFCFIYTLLAIHWNVITTVEGWWIVYHQPLVIVGVPHHPHLQAFHPSIHQIFMKRYM